MAVILRLVAPVVDVLRVLVLLLWVCVRLNIRYMRYRLGAVHQLWASNGCQWLAGEGSFYTGALLFESDL